MGNGEIVLEYNIVRKKISKKLVRIALVYPSTYESMLSSIVTHLIYYMLNELYDEVYVERFYLKKLFGRGEEPRSVETNSPLKDFDLIITSIHYEPNISGLLRILYSSGLEIYRNKRRIPIIAGGPGVIANPHPYEDFIDAFIIGEAEDTLPGIIGDFITYKDNKNGFLEKISSYKYVYVSDYTNRPVRREWTKNLDAAYYPIRQIQNTEIEPVYGHGFLLEVSRGCRFWCRFCMESRLFKPYRRRSNNKLFKLINKGLSVNLLDRVIIYSLLFPGGKEDTKLLEYLVSKGIKGSLPSLRVEYINDYFLELVKDLGQKNLTIAPESFNTFVQRIFGKYFDLNIVNESIDKIISKGFNLKLYIIFGLKNESLDDNKVNIDALRKIAKKINEKNLKLTITLNPLVPKPKTVFQWFGMIDLGKAKNIIRYYRGELKGLVNTRPLYVNWAWIQGSIALADKSISKVLAEWSLGGGDLGSWRRALRNNSYSTSYLFNGYRYDEPLPWDDIVLDKYVEKTLESEYYALARLLNV
ncbi:Radical SAM domain protein [Staphylothermus hellenicus DSM 12710]|uniref:Radical SAM domain protein n=1 Tax=Staphylothermus hellenicus (strain DSM 12710 / JCM 10830 / BK20S6-10-b1 / P8) TaxID=591019 RepID=D7D8W6_STAHD|nr:Radical SAM domain protein [Staphylothermus hellenicus DSM 12710]